MQGNVSRYTDTAPGSGPGVSAKRARGLRALWEQHHLALAVVGCTLFLIMGRLASGFLLPQALVFSLYALAYVSGGFFSLRAGVTTLIRERRIDVDLLMVVAAVAAATIGEWMEGGILLFLFSLSNALQHYAMERTRRAITALMSHRPQEALRKESDGSTRVVPIEELAVGDTIIVRPGELVPIDGTILTGTSSLNESAITGESVPVDKSVGDEVFAGTLNQNGVLEVRVTTLADDTVIARIIRRVEEAESEQAPTQRRIDTIEQYYATGVVLATLLTAVIPGLLGHDWSESIYRAITLMVVASPCAVAMAVPSAVVAALANGARSGVLYKGGMHIENMAEVSVVAFDKTGTLTEGMPEVVEVIPCGEYTEDEILYLAGSVESHSEHPLASAVLRAALKCGRPLTPAENTQAYPGKGVAGLVEGRQVWVGNRRMLESCDAEVPEAVAEQVINFEAVGRTVMLVGVDCAVVGLIAVQDRLRPGAAAAVAALKASGVRRIVMLTGDNRYVGEAIGREAGVDEVYSELLPEDKAAIVSKLRRDVGPVAMVGDGVNDAPALAHATVGVAMGAAGTDVALETADVVLMSNDLSKLPHAIGLSRRARRIIWQNLTFALSVIAVLVVLVLTRGVVLALGVVGHEGSTVLVILNSMRLLFGQHRQAHHGRRPRRGAASTV